jgi:hypothetical protein
MNLSDYKNLVDGLINILEIEDEENKTVNYIVRTWTRYKTINSNFLA